MSGIRIEVSDQPYPDPAKVGARNVVKTLWIVDKKNRRNLARIDLMPSEGFTKVEDALRCLLPGMILDPDDLVAD